MSGEILDAAVRTFFKYSNTIEGVFSAARIIKDGEETWIIINYSKKLFICFPEHSSK